MSIELKQAAQQALKELGEARKIIRASSSRQLAKDWDHRATAVLADLRTAIQQAEAQQPATPEPVGYMNAGNIHELKQGALPYGYVYPQKESGVSVPVYAHPAPSVPDDVVRDAIATVREQYRGTDWGKYAECICDAIDAAMLAAK